MGVLEPHALHSLGPSASNPDPADGTKETGGSWSLNGALGIWVCGGG